MICVGILHWKAIIHRDTPSQPSDQIVASCDISPEIEVVTNVTQVPQETQEPQEPIHHPILQACGESLYENIPQIPMSKILQANNEDGYEVIDLPTRKMARPIPVPSPRHVPTTHCF